MKSKVLPLAIVKSLFNEIDSNSIRVVLEYADVPVLQHEFILRDLFTKVVSNYKAECLEARYSLDMFIEEILLPDVLMLIENYGTNKCTNSSFATSSSVIQHPLSVIFRYSPRHPDKLCVIRNLLQQRSNIKISECKIDYDRVTCLALFSYTIILPQHITEEHQEALLSCNTDLC